VKPYMFRNLAHMFNWHFNRSYGGGRENHKMAQFSISTLPCIYAAKYVCPGHWANM